MSRKAALIGFLFIQVIAIVLWVTALLPLMQPGGPPFIGTADETFTGRIFSAVSRAGVSIVLITQSSSEYSVSFCIHSYDSDKTRKVLEREFELEFKNQLLDPLEIMSDLAIISLIGDGMRTSKGMAARFFTSLAQASINIVAIAQGVPDPSGNIKLIPDADGTLPNSLDLAQYNGSTLVLVWGRRRYQLSGVFFTDASADNDPGAGSLDDTVGFEAATIKQLA